MDGRETNIRLGDAIRRGLAPPVVVVRPFRLRAAKPFLNITFFILRWRPARLAFGRSLALNTVIVFSGGALNASSWKRRT